MKVLFDTNIIIDFLLDRDPFAEDAAILFALVEYSKIEGAICATTVTTVHYLIKKALGDAAAKQHISSLLSLFDVAAVNRLVLEDALTSGFSDYEDAVIHSAALHCGAKFIVTRNPKDFRKSTLPVYDPSEFLKILDTLRGKE